jgi:hypothetical protein
MHRCPVIQFSVEVTMDEDRLLGAGDDWAIVQRMLPEGWREQAKALGALRRCREFADPGALLRVMLIHLADGCSLRETAVRAAQGGLVVVSDVALLKRLKACGEWFRWMADALMQRWVVGSAGRLLAKGLRIRVVDGSLISEPGATGSSWRVHYSLSLPSLRCDEVYVTEPVVGESLQRFTVHRGELFVADRGYAQRAGIAHIVKGGADLIVRLNLTNVPLQDAQGKAFPLLGKLRTLKGARLGDWPVWVADGKQRIRGRVCAVKKSQQAAQRARAKAARESAHHGHQVRPQTLEAADYTFVFTTLAERYSPALVLEMYRCRWQVELAFKRLKSLLALGHLKKTDPDGAKAWLQGKLLVAFLIEALIAAAERFSPWGYPLEQVDEPLPLA